MVSVLVPVYQYDVVGLVVSLSHQFNALGVGYEILVYDDCSAQEYKSKNRILCDYAHVRYVELDCNIGRSRIRNLLASEARFENLLFLDCDVNLPDNDFVKRYLDYAAKFYVTVGGISYRSERPRDSAKVLRWKYGHTREAQCAKLRNKRPYASFKTANFFITKADFFRVRFSEAISGYGHEDTLFGYQLGQAGVAILHIDNPVYHDGLEDASAFIAKSEQAVANLYLLFQSGELANSWKEIPLLRYYMHLKVLHLRYLAAVGYSILGALMRNLMQSRFSFVFLFNVYKLMYMSYVSIYGVSGKK